MTTQDLLGIRFLACKNERLETFVKFTKKVQNEKGYAIFFIKTNHWEGGGLKSRFF